MFLCLPLLADIIMDTAFAATVSFGLQELVYLMSGIPLLARLLITFLDQLFYFQFVRCQNRCWAFLLQPISFRLSVIDRLADQPATVMQPLPDRSYTQSFQIICLAYAFVIVHRFHLLCTSGSNSTEVTLRWAHFRY